MAKTAFMSIRIEPKLKKEAEQIFKALGLTPSEAITLFFRQVVLQQKIPFEIGLLIKK